MAIEEGLAFSLHLPTRVIFGRGTRDRVGREVATFGRRAVVVSGRSFATGPEMPRLVSQLASSGVDVVGRIVARGEPDTAAVLAACTTLIDARSEVVIAVGGGSAIDLAKASALCPSPAQLGDYLGGVRVEDPIGLPVVALPTTAGSGSEVSHAAIVLDQAAQRKRGVRGSGVAPRVAIVDPDLMDGLPAEVAASSGFDALAHAIETAVSMAATPHVVALSGIAIRRLLDAVPRSVRADAMPADRESAAYAALLMGINLAASTTCLPHRLQYPLGAQTGCGHAEGVAALMPAWLERTARSAPERLARLALEAGLVAQGDTIEVSAARLRDSISLQIDATGMRRRLADFGVVAKDVDGLVASVEGTLSNDPGPTAPEDLRALYLASL